MKITLPILGFLAGLTLPAAAHDIDEHATLLGNAGVMVISGEEKILFDTFYDNDFGDYALVPNDSLSKLNADEKPYDDIAALFISHVHEDHFNAQMVRDYLTANPNVVLFGPQQAATAMQEIGIDEEHPLFERIKTFKLDFGERIPAFKHDLLTIDALAVPHGGGMPEIKNILWWVQFDSSLTVAHFGDADPIPKDFEPHKDYFGERPIDMAFVAFWFYLRPEGQALLADTIGAKSSIGLHVPKRAQADPEGWKAQIGNDLMITPGEIRTLNHHHE